MTPRNSLVFAVIVFMISNDFTGVVAQTDSSYDCNKYCHKDCGAYFHGPEFSYCFSAKVHCTCISKLSIRNPLIIVLAVAGIMLSCFVGTVCCFFRYWRNQVARLQTVYGTAAYPLAVVPVIPANIDGNRYELNNPASYQGNSAIRYANPVAAYPYPSNNNPTEQMLPPR